MQKIVRAAVLSGALAVGSLTLAAPAQAAPTVSAAPVASAAGDYQAMGWPAWGVYRNLATCISEGVRLQNAGILSDFACVPNFFNVQSMPHTLLGLLA
ncbi:MULTISPECIES: hypothetical protein [Micromonospora]|uniref:hypothetical protein n=1 Tax=Micromonospora TaxID=1873 RepID=UPI001EE79B2F|nr:MULTISPECIES: hypothetical protein [Micromonospora]MCG5450848.1 hypothetical protein [Micromonospora hortensis]MCX5119537.1 hypothetical protein [Micromonospora sp. NBC_00362]WTI08429.1 hypothetical protein OHB44_01685 [Micromonospora sp. NBC_00821]